MSQLAIITQEISLPANLTHREKGIIRATQARKVNELSDDELSTLVLVQMNKALIRMGHGKQQQSKEDQKILRDELAKLIGSSFHYFTEAEVAMVFELGSQGDLKAKEDEVDFLSLPTVNRWFKRYRETVKAEAMKQYKKGEVAASEPESCPLPPEHEARMEFTLDHFRTQISQIKVSGYFWDFGSAAYYDWLVGLGIINLTPERKKEIYQQEREQYIKEYKSSKGLTLDFRAAFKKYLEAVEEEKAPAANDPVEAQVRNRCKQRVFRDLVMDSIKNEEDLPDKIEQAVKAYNLAQKAKTA
jgi:hypothetical protein